MFHQCLKKEGGGSEGKRAKEEEGKEKKEEGEGKEKDLLVSLALLSDVASRSLATKTST